MENVKNTCELFWINGKAYPKPEEVAIVNATTMFSATKDYLRWAFQLFIRAIEDHKGVLGLKLANVKLASRVISSDPQKGRGALVMQDILQYYPIPDKDEDIKTWHAVVEAVVMYLHNYEALKQKTTNVVKVEELIGTEDE